MTKVQGVYCNVCGDEITRGLWATFKRSTIKLKLRKRGIVNYAPVEDGWRRERIDLCNQCWKEVLETVYERVDDD